MSFKEIKPTENLVEAEHRILDFWQKNQIFSKLVKKNKGQEKWSFLDGPITANNPMGVHHAWGRTYKDIFQRYKAMQGFDQRYQNGFDCQGLWVEVEVEKDLGFKTKKDIESYGIEKFVNLCKERVLKYSKIQTDQSIRLGQWMDWDNSYYTMSEENNYAIWHFLKVCFEKGYLYKGKDSVPWCPRCGTAISQHEILTEEYKQITHQAVYFKLPIISEKFENTYFLVWTTTPWTLLANVALAVNPEFVYGLYEKENEKLILLKTLAEKILGSEYQLKKEYHGQELLGLKYNGPFDSLERVKKALEESRNNFHIVIEAKDLVTADEGTGIVHIAPGAGAEDFKLGKANNLPVISVIDSDASYLDDLGDFSGKNAKENPEIILNYLENFEDGKYLYKIEDYSHRYPTCWRCKEELVWRVVDEWYISMDKLREPMIEVTRKINWLPSFGLDRELDWLNNMQDWLISKKRYWGLALPIYECSCGHFEVIGSKEELKEKAVEGWEDFEGKSPHRPWIDKVKIKCSKCGKIISRILDVGNPWLDAGIVPFSTLKYFEDKNYWQNWYPVEFICESFPGQFKNWFYSLIAMATVLENAQPFKNVLGYASVKDEKSEEMHKSKGNAIWFSDAAEKMGVDIMRWMFATANPYENLNFGYKHGEEIYRRFVLIFRNVCQFFVTYANIDNWQSTGEVSKNVLDRWIIARLNQVVIEVTKNLDKYQPQQATRSLEGFIINDLSTWFLRRSRSRKGPEFYETLHFVLLETLKLFSPFMPFLSEAIYQNLKNPNDPESVHLCSWPKAGEIDEKLLADMQEVRNIVEIGHSLRAESGVRLRQPLAKIEIPIKLNEDLNTILKDELNVLEVVEGSVVKLDTILTPELKARGAMRDLVRLIQDLRKKSGLVAGQKVVLLYKADEEIEKIISEFQSEITKLTSVELKKTTEITGPETEFTLEGKKIYFKLEK